MMNLAEYRQKPRLADFLPWAALVDEGVVLNKDGSLQRTARFRGPDLDSATPAELVGDIGAPEQRAASPGIRLGDLRRGQRHAAQGYPQSQFPDPVSALVDAERQGPVRGGGRPLRECAIT